MRLVSAVVFGPVGVGCSSDLERDPGDVTPLPEYHVAASPTAVIGGAEYDALERVVGAAMIGANLAIADAGAHKVVVFDSSGTEIASHGREGFGPQEYRSLQGVYRGADGLVAWDGGHSRLVFLDSLAEYRRGLPIEPHPGRLNQLEGVAGTWAVFSARELGFFGAGAEGPVEVRRPVKFTVVGVEDRATVQELELPGQEEWAMRTGDGRSSALPVPLGRTVRVAATDLGVVLGTTDSTTVRVLNGAVEESLVLHLEGPVDSEDWANEARERLRSRILSATYGEAAKSFDLDLLATAPVRSEPPAFEDLRGGVEGDLWVREASSPADSVGRWLVLDSRGQPVRRVMIPATATVLDVSLESVVLLRVGLFDEHLVEWYHLERVGGPKSD